MRLFTRCVLICSLVAPAIFAARIPVGSHISIRLETKLDSSVDKAEKKIEATVIRPIMVDGEPAIPAGAKVLGQVKKALPVVKDTDRAMFDLEFTTLGGASGSEQKLHAKLIDVDNARESVDANGHIIGILASETLTAQMSRGIDMIEKSNPMLADVLQGVKAAFLSEAQPEIVYEPGVEMTLELSRDAQISSIPTPKPRGSISAIPNESELYKVVNSQPCQARAEKPPVPSDLTNLMFFGTEQQLTVAFEAAGWTKAAALNTNSGLEVFRAIVEMRGYKEAPVSILTLDGRKPDFVFQKQNNTFAKRHHLRIWRRPGSFLGRPIWIAAATHDISIDFSPEQRTFIHRIDPLIDRERAKIVNDLIFSGRVASLSLVDRPAVPKLSQNATGDRLETDGMMAVLLFR